MNRDKRFEELDRLIAAGLGDTRGLAKLQPLKALTGRPRTNPNIKPAKTPRSYVRMATNFALPGQSRVETIAKLVEDSYGYAHGTLKQNATSREPRFMHPRHIVIYIARLTTGLSTNVIAGYFRLDHSTVIHAYDVLRGCIEHSSEIADFVYGLIVQLKSVQHQRKPVSSVGHSEPAAESSTGPSQR